MKLIRSLSISAGLLSGLAGANVAHANLTYLVDINTSSIVNRADGPFSIDFTSLYGSGAAQTITLSGFFFTGGTTSGFGTSTGAVSGNLATSLVLNPDSSNFLNEFYQELGAGVSDIRFILDLTTNPSGVTPTSFAVSLLDSTLANIPTTGISDSLLAVSIDGSNTIFSTGSSTGATNGVTISVSAVPEPSTYGLVAGLLALGACIIRRRFSLRR